MTDSQKWFALVITAAVGVLLYLLQPILAPFLAGFLLAYLGNPVVDRLVRWRFPRVLAVSVVFLAITLVFLALLGVLLPGLKHQIEYLQKKTPDFIQWVNTQVIPWVSNTFQIDLKHFDFTDLTNLIGTSWQEAGTFAGQLLSKVATSGLSIIGFLGNMVLIPVVTFYLMLDWHMLLEKAHELIPRQMEPRVSKLVKDCDEVLGSFFRGQFLVMISLGVVYSLGLKIVGLDIAIVVGMLAGFGSFIPYFGFTVGIVIATVAAIFQFQEALPVLWVWTVFGIGQIIEGWVLIPYLVGNKVGLHPVAVIFAILAGGQLFGFFGMLLAIPVTAVIVVILRYFRQRYVNSTLYNAET